MAKGVREQNLFRSKSVSHMTRLVLLLTLMLSPSTSGLDSMCDATQNATCDGALGGPVYLQLMRNARGYDLNLYNGSAHIFRFKSKSVFFNEFNTTSVLQRWQFVPDNGTMIINPAERRDAGTYRVGIFKDGRSVGEYTVQLTIEAPVSDVDLSINCSANGERSVKCSSNGDSPQYSWSLDGRSLGEADADLSSDNQTLLLRGNVTGQLTCSVSNHVSSTHTTRLMELCSESETPPPTAKTAESETPRPSAMLAESDALHPSAKTGMVLPISVCLAAILVCVLVVGGILYVCKRKKRTQTESTMDLSDHHTHTVPGEHEVAYAEIHISGSRGQQRGQPCGVYEEVKPAAVSASPAQQVYSVYAQLGPAMGPP
ncbi:uncharacterized protein LOC134096235 [Sardina pilchardus]|uniref:uncharacterized protein LOC134096235 n=1 Tax=Sardina pilchardus TaxID=27697 RepID=UPI002E0E950A